MMLPGDRLLPERADIRRSFYFLSNRRSGEHTKGMARMGLSGCSDCCSCGSFFGTILWSFRIRARRQPIVQF
jgi:hypothetical protein